MLPVLMTFLMFLTPVLYAKPAKGILASVTNYNPLYYMVSIPREVVLTGGTSEWKGFLISSAIAMIVFLGCLIIFHLTETRIAEKV